MSVSAPPVRRCAICGKSAEPAYHPFCSKRCADVDLQRWLGGVYVIPGESEERGDGQPPPPEDRG